MRFFFYRRWDRRTVPRLLAFFLTAGLLTLLFLAARQMGPLLEAMPPRVKYCAVGRPYISLRLAPGEDPLTILRDAVALLNGGQNRG